MTVTSAPQSPARAGPSEMSGIVCAALSVLLFSCFTLASRRGLTSSLKPPDIAALRFGVGGLVLLPVLLRHGLRGLRARSIGLLALFGGLGFASLAYAGFALAPAAHGAVLLHGTLPLFTWILLNPVERVEAKARPLGIALIATGIVLMALDSVRGATLRQLAGDGLLLLASSFWASYGVFVRRLRVPPTQGAAIVAVFSALFYLPLYTLLPHDSLFQTSARELLLQAAVQGLLIGAVSIFIYTRAVATLGAARTSLFSAAVPGLTTVAAVPLLAEYPDILAVTGVCIVTLGMVIAAGARGNGQLVRTSMPASGFGGRRSR